MDKINKNSLLLSCIIVLIYSLITLTAVFHHEIWADEAQVWMLCKYLSPVELIKHLVNEGHPSFFYWLVMPFAKISDNIIFMQLVCWFSSVLAIFLLWYYSKFNPLTKTVITISAPFIYFFPVVARNYSLIAPLVFILAILHNKTEKHPFIYSFALIFLANTHAIMFCFCALLALRFLYKEIFLKIKSKTLDKKAVIAGSIIILGLIALVAQLIGTTSSNCFITFGKQSTFGSAIRVILLFLFNSFDSHYMHSHIQYFNSYTLTFLFFILLSYVLLPLFLFFKNKSLFIILVLSFTFQLAVYILTYNYYVFPTRIYSGYLIVLFCYWILADSISKDAENKKDKKILNFLISFFFILTLWNGIFNYYGDYVFDYSSSKRTAEFIKNNIDPNNSVLYVDDPPPCVPLAYYLDGLYDIRDTRNDGRKFKYVIWNKELLYSYDNQGWRILFSSLRKFGEKKDLYAVVIYNIFDEDRNLNTMGEDYFDLFYVSGDALDFVERFKIYKYKY